MTCNNARRVPGSLERKERTVEEPETRIGVAQRRAYRLSEAAQLIGISEKSVRRLISRGLLKPNRALRILLISSEELARFLRDN